MNEEERLKLLLQGNLYDRYLYYKNLCNSYQASCVRKDKIKEKLEEIRKQYNNILSSDNVSLEFKNINSHRFDAMSQVLEELLKGI